MTTSAKQLRSAEGQATHSFQTALWESLHAHRSLICLLIPETGREVAVLTAPETTQLLPTAMMPSSSPWPIGNAANRSSAVNGC